MRDCIVVWFSHCFGFGFGDRYTFETRVLLNENKEERDFGQKLVEDIIPDRISARYNATSE